VDDHRINFDRLEENDIAGDAVADAGIRRIHEAAAVFHDKGSAAKLLNVGQRLQECGRFGDQVLHRAESVSTGGTISTMMWGWRAA
jgi:hypothetical protein